MREVSWAKVFALREGGTSSERYRPKDNLQLRGFLPPPLDRFIASFTVYHMKKWRGVNLGCLRDWLHISAPPPSNFGPYLLSGDRVSLHRLPIYQHPSAPVASSPYIVLPGGRTSFREGWFQVDKSRALWTPKDSVYSLKTINR